MRWIGAQRSEVSAGENEQLYSFDGIDRPIHASPLAKGDRHNLRGRQGHKIRLTVLGVAVTAKGHHCAPCPLLAQGNCLQAAGSATWDISLAQAPRATKRHVCLQNGGRPEQPANLARCCRLGTVSSVFPRRTNLAGRGMHFAHSLLPDAKYLT